MRILDIEHILSDDELLTTGRDDCRLLVINRRYIRELTDEVADQLWREFPKVERFPGRSYTPLRIQIARAARWQQLVNEAL